MVNAYGVIVTEYKNTHEYDPDIIEFTEGIKTQREALIRENKRNTRSILGSAKSAGLARL